MEFFCFEALRSNMDRHAFPASGRAEAELRGFRKPKSPVEDGALLDPGAAGVMENQPQGTQLRWNATVAIRPTNRLSASIRNFDP